MISDNLTVNNINGLEFITFPHFTACNKVRHIFSTRLGGVSRADLNKPLKSDRKAVESNGKQSEDRKNQLLHGAQKRTCAGVGHIHAALCHIPARRLLGTLERRVLRRDADRAAAGLQPAVHPAGADAWTPRPVDDSAAGAARRRVLHYKVVHL